MGCRCVDGEFVVATAEVLIEGVIDGETAADPRRFRPRIGRILALSRPWSASIRLFAYCSVTCTAAGTNSSYTRRYGPALSEVISVSAGQCCSARRKNRLAASVSRRSDKTNVDDLPELIHRAIQVPPPTSDLDVGRRRSTDPRQRAGAGERRRRTAG